ncbi:MAG: periplasmic heavy metal sensor [Hyphomicrobiales bacterium]
MSNEDNGSTQAAPKPPGRWLKIGLVLSLMLNALFIGAIGMSAYKHKNHGGWHGARHGGGGGFLGARQFYQELPEARRKELRSSFRKARSNYRRDFVSDRNASVEKVASLLEAPELDANQLTEALTAHSQTRRGFSQRYNEHLVEIAKTLSADERKLMAKSMRTAHERRKKRRKKWRDRKKD